MDGREFVARYEAAASGAAGKEAVRRIWHAWEVDNGVCCQCGESDREKLECDHVPGRGVKYREIPDLLRLEDSRLLLSELWKVQRLCKRCHRAEEGSRRAETKKVLPLFDQKLGGKRPCTLEDVAGMIFREFHKIGVTLDESQRHLITEFFRKIRDLHYDGEARRVCGRDSRKAEQDIETRVNQLINDTTRAFLGHARELIPYRAAADLFRLQAECYRLLLSGAHAASPPMGDLPQ